MIMAVQRVVVATIKDNRTGITKEVAEHKYPFNYEDHTIIFHWTEGNYACDCNRAIFFYGYDSPEARKAQSELCSNTRFNLVSLKVDGEELLK